MTDSCKLFVAAYIECGNATAAAIEPTITDDLPADLGNGFILT